MHFANTGYAEPVMPRTVLDMNIGVLIRHSFSDFLQQKDRRGSWPTEYSGIVAAAAVAGQDPADLAGLWTTELGSAVALSRSGQHLSLSIWVCRRVGTSGGSAAVPPGRTTRGRGHLRLLTWSSDAARPVGSTE